MTIAAATAAMAAYRIVLRSTAAAAPGTMASLLGSRRAAGSALPQLARQPPALAGSVRLVHGSSGGGLACMGYGSNQSGGWPRDGQWLVMSKLPQGPCSLPVEHGGIMCACSAAARWT